MSAERKYGRAVTLSGFCFIDPRFDDLAEICGLGDGDIARIKMARLWQQAAAAEDHLVSARSIARLFGDRGVDGVIACKLGRHVGGAGWIRLSGTDAHLRWAEQYKEAAKQQKAAGAARAAGAPRDAKGRLLPRKTAGQPLDNAENATQRQPAEIQLASSAFLPAQPAVSQRRWIGAGQAKSSGNPAPASENPAYPASSTSTSTSSLNIGDHANAQRDLESPGVCVVSPRARAAKNTHTVSAKLSETLPEGWQPNTAARELAASLRLDLDGEARHFANLKRSQGHVSRNWDAAFCAFLDGSAKRRAPKPMIAPGDKPRRLKRIG